MWLSLCLCSGYFAGLTIEVDDVVLDLNGHEIKMAKAFYYQQPYFSIIEVENQPFLPQQGPGFFGSDPIYPSRVTIKNGVLGLSQGIQHVHMDVRPEMHAVAVLVKVRRWTILDVQRGAR